ncbi:GTPase HflX [SAR86 cluster bacterium]|jgi:GTP-binding protein HflX|nr:GTPase HflX [SAR86 cluster bacterium]
MNESKTLNEVIIVNSSLGNLINLNANEIFSEFKELVSSTSAEIIDEFNFHQKTINAKYFIGKGKLEEIKNTLIQHNCSLVIFNHDLSPSQERNIESFLNSRVLDRTGLILDIFARRASSHIGKMQVELAQLSHLSTRLVRGWSHLERQKGGIGLRGPGETQLETDRRLISNRIKGIKKRLIKSHQQKNLNRYSRKKGRNHIVGIVGYTNAGKTTLFNQLTGSSEFEADKMFATLDTVTRKNLTPGSESIIYIDTVGFISDLPTSLIESFKATLDDLKSADLLLHVVDVNDRAFENKIFEVNKTLVDIGAENIPQIFVKNKVDLVEKIDFEINNVVNSVNVSAKEGIGIELLKDLVSSHANRGLFKGKLFIDFKNPNIRAKCFKTAKIIKEISTNTGWEIELIIGNYDLKKLLNSDDIKIINSEEYLQEKL